jgi:hypothetical protein
MLFSAPDRDHCVPALLSMGDNSRLAQIGKLPRLEYQVEHDYVGVCHVVTD